MHRAIALLLLAVPLLASDLTGSYSGKVTMKSPRGDQVRPLTITIRQTSADFAVTVGPNPGEQHEATNVKLEDDMLSFEVIPPGSKQPAMKWDLKIEENLLTGTQLIMPRDGGMRTGTVEVTKR